MLLQYIVNGNVLAGFAGCSGGSFPVQTGSKLIMYSNRKNGLLTSKLSC